MRMMIAKAGTTMTAINVGWHHASAMYMPSLFQAGSVSVVVHVAITVTVTITVMFIVAVTVHVTVTVAVIATATATAIANMYGNADEATTRRSHLEQAGSLEPTLPFGVTMIAKAWQDNWLCEIASRFHQDSGLGCGPAGHGVQQSEPANGHQAE